MLYGVGINDADYNITTIVDGKTIRCPYYTVWSNMLARCYSVSYQRKKESYKGCTVCDDWLKFTNFKAWMKDQDWVDKELDKDLLIPDNKTYSAETCIFLDRSINGFIRDTKQGNEWPVGVYWRANRNVFIAQVRDTIKGTTVRVGQFKCPQEAHRAWRKAKHELAIKLAETQSNPKVKQAILTRYLNDSTNSNI